MPDNPVVFPHRFYDDVFPAVWSEFQGTAVVLVSKLILPHSYIRLRARSVRVLVIGFQFDSLCVVRYRRFIFFYAVVYPCPVVI